MNCPTCGYSFDDHDHYRGEKGDASDWCIRCGTWFDFDVYGLADAKPPELVDIIREWANKTMCYGGHRGCDCKFCVKLQEKINELTTK